MGRVWAEGWRLREKAPGVGAATNEDGVGRGGRLAGWRSRSKEACSAMEVCPLAGAAGVTAAAGRPHAPPQPASSAAARTVERGSCAVVGGEFSGRLLLSSSNPMPMGSPKLDCSSFFAGGVLVRCNSLRALDQHCRLVSSCSVLLPPSYHSAVAIEQVRRSARLLHLQLCAAVQGLLDSFCPTCLFFLAAHMLLFL
ncbi:uncharacterized protein LOC119340342 isoform X1 [Triticum dicoccoides]|nr:uncharacterized protein LOC119340342 isoform X1 [Triticum dicoccoides]